MDNSIDRLTIRDVDSVELLLVPGDLHTCDPSFRTEIDHGHFGLDGMFLEIGEDPVSVFNHPHTDESFQRILHGFTWLRDLRDADEIEAQQLARQLVFAWIKMFKELEGVAYEPGVLANRIISFLMNAPLIMSDLNKKQSRVFMRTLVQQIEVLRRKREKVPIGLPRIKVLSALVMGSLCLGKHKELQQEVEPLLVAELEGQILEDGGHISRNPGALLDLLFDLHPLRLGFKSREETVPEALNTAISRMSAMIRFMRMGDSSLGRFNGHGTTPTDALAILLAQEHRKRKKPVQALQSGYRRIEEGPTIALVDTGTAPDTDYADRAHAGCLSFEMSVRHFALVVNAGSYRGEDKRWRTYARSTSAHSALSIDNHSSCGFDQKSGAAAPIEVCVDKEEVSNVEASHKGYEKQFGLVHHRALALSYKGLRLEGVDHLKGPGGKGESRFQVRFHLHPRIELARSDESNLLLTLPDGEIWRFTATGADIEMGDSVYLAYKQGVEPSHQIVLKGTARSGAIINWQFEQYRPRPPASDKPKVS